MQSAVKDTTYGLILPMIYAGLVDSTQGFVKRQHAVLYHNACFPSLCRIAE